MPGVVVALLLDRNDDPAQRRRVLLVAAGARLPRELRPLDCDVSPQYYGYMRPSMDHIRGNAITVCVELICNALITGKLRKQLQSTARSRLSRTTCLSVSFAFVVCIVCFSPSNEMRYGSRDINVYLHGLNGAPFRSELVALLCHRARAWSDGGSLDTVSSSKTVCVLPKPWRWRTNVSTLT